MKITKEQVQYVANLSRIELTEHDEETFQAQLNAILEYMDKLNQLDTTGVEPMSSVMGLKNVFRKDEPTASLPTDEALANAPARTTDSYKVPAVIE